MAKELAMIEKTDIGRMVRRYFIQCERLAFQQAGTSSNKITESQKQQIKEAVNKSHHRTQESHQAIYLKLHALCKVSTYTEINATDFNLAIRFLNSIENTPVFKDSSAVLPTGQHLITDNEVYEIMVAAGNIRRMALLLDKFLPALHCLESSLVAKCVGYSEAYVSRTETIIEIVNRLYPDVKPDYQKMISKAVTNIR